MILFQVFILFLIAKNENYRRSDKKVVGVDPEPNLQTMSIPIRTPSTPVRPSMLYNRQQLLNMRSNADPTVSNEIVRRLDFDNIFNSSSRADVINSPDNDIGER
jgi:hypothetical protein